jgi:chromate reductase
MLLMASSPGGRGGASVLAMARDRFPRHDAQITGVFSLPSFHNNFKDGEISDVELRAALNAEVKTFEDHL